MAAIDFAMNHAMSEAEAITYAQVSTALRMNAEFFDGQGMTNFPAILHALATSYAAHYPYWQGVDPNK